MRVTYIINNQFPADGVGNSIVNLCRLLRSLGHDLKVLHEKEVNPPDDLRDTFAPATYEEFERHDGAIAAGPAVAHWLQSDLILVDYSTFYPLARVVALPVRGTTVFIYHGVTPPKLWSSPTGLDDVCKGVEHLPLARHADFAVTASPFTRDELIAAGVDKDRIAVLPYCVHPDRFCPQPKDATLQRLWNLQGHFVLLYVGRMARNKRIDVLVRGLAAAQKSDLPIKLLLVGDSESEPYRLETEKAQALAAELGVDEDVVFTGPVRDELLPRYFNLADLYVTASLHEGFGFPLVEAMSAGKPIVAGRSASIPWVVHDGGRLFDPEDGAGMGVAVLELLQSVMDRPAPPAEPPRLCFVVPRYGPGFSGGAETLCCAWAETCHRAGWPVQVVTTTTEDMVLWENHFGAGDEELNGVPVKRF